MGAPKAITATAHKLARILYNLMRHGIAYMKKEEAAYAEQVRERLEKQLHRRAKEETVAPPRERVGLRSQENRNRSQGEADK